MSLFKKSPQTRTETEIGKAAVDLVASYLAVEDREEVSTVDFWKSHLKPKTEAQRREQLSVLALILAEALQGYEVLNDYSDESEHLCDLMDILFHSIDGVENQDSARCDACGSEFIERGDR